ncbi:MAG: thermonuclease family protein [Sphingosinicella sp.]|nr:thermonuclease family protein [Sphingosinicella sp.]
MFICTVTSVWDGDGPIHCAEGQKIRLHAIAAREIDETCTAGHPCPSASGAEAKRALQRFALGQTLRCEATGTSYARMTAWCWRRDGLELNCAMIRSGTALRWDKYDRQRKLCRRVPRFLTP